MNPIVNCKKLYVDVDFEINPTSIILYKDNLDEYLFQIFLLSGRNYFYLDNSAFITIYIDDTKIPEPLIRLADLYKGQINVKLNKSIFADDISSVTAPLEHEMKIHIHYDSTYGVYDTTTTIPFIVVDGEDPHLDGFDAQNIRLSNSTLPIPTDCLKPIQSEMPTLPNYFTCDISALDSDSVLG